MLSKEDYILLCLMEECAELQMALSKMIRFGGGCCHPDGGPTNYEQVHHEIIDVCALIEMTGITSETNRVLIRDAMDKKKRKVEFYYSRSKELWEENKEEEIQCKN